MFKNAYRGGGGWKKAGGERVATFYPPCPTALREPLNVTDLQDSPVIFKRAFAFGGVR